MQKVKFFLLNGKNKKKFLSANTKTISSHVLKRSAISPVLRTREMPNIFNTFDEIYLVFTSKKVNYPYLSYDVAVIQWKTSCHKNRMTTLVLTLWCVCVTSLTTSVVHNAFSHVHFEGNEIPF